MEDHKENKTPLDIEEYAKAEKPIPKDCELFRIRIDRDKYIVQQAALTGRELLKLADKDPETHAVYFRKCGGKNMRIELNVNFSFLNPGVERFITEEIGCGETNVKVYINTRDFIAKGPQISFEEVINEAHPELVGKPNVFFTVTYKDGCVENPKGDLVHGQNVYVKKEMSFNVRATDKS